MRENIEKDSTVMYICMREKENIIRKEATRTETAAMETGKERTRSCNSHEVCADKGNVGSSEIVPENGQKNVGANIHDTTYGPWIMVSRKVSGARSQRSNRGPPGQENDQNRNRSTRSSFVKEKWANVGFTRDEQAVGPLRETKRKMVPTKVMDEALGEGSNMGLSSFKELKGLRLAGLSLNMSAMDSNLNLANSQSACFY